MNDKDKALLAWAISCSEVCPNSVDNDKRLTKLKKELMSTVEVKRLFVEIDEINEKFMDEDNRRIFSNG